MVAELRPVSGKKTLRRAIPANPSDVSKPQIAQDRGDLVGVAGHDGRSLTMATASGGASWWRNRAEGKNGEDGGGCCYL